MMALSCSPEVAWKMAAMYSCKKFFQILIRYSRDTRARQTRMRGTTNRMSHGYSEERILAGVWMSAVVSFP
jgi:hypothetical protein